MVAGSCHSSNPGPLAQLVEQETLNLLVVGSIPTRPTIYPLQGVALRPGARFNRRSTIDHLPELFLDGSKNIRRA